jgi:hypothetical protein
MVKKTINVNETSEKNYNSGASYEAVLQTLFGAKQSSNVSNHKKKQIFILT